MPIDLNSLNIPNIINYDQTGFLKDRFVGENIRLIDGIIKYTAAKNIPGLLFFLDFEKAFDTVEWSFLQKNFTVLQFWAICYQLDQALLP